MQKTECDLTRVMSVVVVVLLRVGLRVLMGSSQALFVKPFMNCFFVLKIWAELPEKAAYVSSRWRNQAVT